MLTFTRTIEQYADDLRCNNDEVCICLNCENVFNGSSGQDCNKCHQEGTSVWADEYIEPVTT